MKITRQTENYNELYEDRKDGITIGIIFIIMGLALIGVTAFAPNTRNASSAWELGVLMIILSILWILAAPNETMKIDKTTQTLTYYSKSYLKLNKKIHPISDIQKVAVNRGIVFNTGSAIRKNQYYDWIILKNNQRIMIDTDYPVLTPGKTIAEFLNIPYETPG